MDHIVNNPGLDHIDVLVLCWSSENSPFQIDNLVQRFPFFLDHTYELGIKIKGLIEQFYLSKEVGSDNISHYSYIPPPDAPDIPKLFTEFCHNYKAAGGRVSSIPYCWGRMKKHKGYKNYLKLLIPALEAQVVDREAKKQKGTFVADWRLLETWINKRGWEDLVSDDVILKAAETEEMTQYKVWLSKKYGATAKPLLSEAQYASFVKGTGAFSRINTLIGYNERVFIFEHAHTSYYNGMTAGANCYEYLVKLYKSKSE